MQISEIKKCQKSETQCFMNSGLATARYVEDDKVKVRLAIVDDEKGSRDHAIGCQMASDHPQ